jgi:5-methyltetrahydropteroyltriglutamate--homocysteine methyltransferase
MFVASKDRPLATTTTGALPRPSWFTENLRGAPLSVGFSHSAYREQHFDTLAANAAMQHRAGIDIFVDGDCRLDDDWAGRAWVSYPLERIEGIEGFEVKPQFSANLTGGRGPGDIMWEVVETRMTPAVVGPIGRTRLELDRAWRAMAGMTDRPCKIGSASAQVLSMMVDNRHYKDRVELVYALSDALNAEYHALADAGAPLLQVEEPEIHQTIRDPNNKVRPETWVDAFNREVKGLRARTEVWAHTCWGSPAAQRVAGADANYERALAYYDGLDVDVLCLEGASNRCAELPLYGRHISKDKKIAVGILNHRTLQIERPDEIAELIRLCVKHIEPERLIVTSDCGFGRQGMSRMHALYKMVALVRGANIVRRELGLPEAYIPATDPALSMVPLAKG